MQSFVLIYFVLINFIYIVVIYDFFYDQFSVIGNRDVMQYFLSQSFLRIVLNFFNYLHGSCMGSLELLENHVIQQKFRPMPMEG